MLQRCETVFVGNIGISSFVQEETDRFDVRLNDRAGQRRHAFFVLTIERFGIAL